MASTISAGTTTTTALVYSADTSGVLQLQTNGGTTALTLDTSQNATFAGKVASASSLQLATNGTTTAVTIDTNQNVGVSVTPSAWRSATKALQIGSYTNLTSDNTNAALQLTSNAYNNGTNWIYENNGYANSYQNYQGQHLWYNAPSGTAGNAITFTQAMLLDASGKLLNTCTNNAEVAFSTQHSGTLPQGIQVTYTSASPNNSGTGNTFLYCVDTTTVRAYISGNGGLNNYSANNTNLSDSTMKKDITPAKSYLSILNQIPVVTFLFNDQTDTELNLGATAQSVQAVAPELVGTIDVGTKEEPNIKLAIYETDLKYAMLKAIQELAAQVTTLQTQVTALQAKVGV